MNQLTNVTININNIKKLFINNFKNFFHIKNNFKKFHIPIMIYDVNKEYVINIIDSQYIVCRINCVECKQ